jgi:hypothetical protein
VVKFSDRLAAPVGTLRMIFLIYRLVTAQLFVGSVYTSSAILTAYQFVDLELFFLHGGAVVALVPLCFCEMVTD